MSCRVQFQVSGGSDGSILVGLDTVNTSPVQPATITTTILRPDLFSNVHIESTGSGGFPLLIVPVYTSQPYRHYTGNPHYG